MRIGPYLAEDTFIITRKKVKSVKTKPQYLCPIWNPWAIMESKEQNYVITLKYTYVYIRVYCVKYNIDT